MSIGRWNPCFACGQTGHQQLMSIGRRTPFILRLYQLPRPSFAGPAGTDLFCCSDGAGADSLYSAVDFDSQRGLA